MSFLLITTILTVIIEAFKEQYGEYKKYKLPLIIILAIIGIGTEIAKYVDDDKNKTETEQQKKAYEKKISELQALLNSSRLEQTNEIIRKKAVEESFQSLFIFTSKINQDSINRIKGLLNIESNLRKQSEIKLTEKITSTGDKTKNDVITTLHEKPIEVKVNGLTTKDVELNKLKREKLSSFIKSGNEILKQCIKYKADSSRQILANNWYKSVYSYINTTFDNSKIVRLNQVPNSALAYNGMTIKENNFCINFEGIINNLNSFVRELE